MPISPRPMSRPHLALEPDPAAERSPNLPAADSARSQFASAYAEHFAFVWRTLRLLGVSDHALEDAAQDVFGIAYRRLSEFEGRAQMGTWLFAIARRVAANFHRRQRRKLSRLEPLTGSEVSGQPTPLAEVEARRTADAMVAFCQTLDEERRALFVLALIEDLPVPDLVVPLGMPLNTLYSRIRALRQRLRNFLELREVER